MQRVFTFFIILLLLFATGCSASETESKETANTIVTTASTEETTTEMPETTTEIPETTTETPETTTETPSIDTPSMESDLPWPEFNENLIPFLHFHGEETEHFTAIGSWDIENGLIQIGEDQFRYAENNGRIGIFAYDGNNHVAVFEDPTEIINEDLVVLTYDDSRGYWVTANLYEAEPLEIVWIDGAENEKHFTISDISSPSGFGIRNIIQRKIRPFYFAKDGDALRLFFLYYDDESLILDIYMLHYFPADPNSSTWHEYSLSSEYTAVWVSSNHEESKYIDNKLYMTSATHIVCLDLETGEVTTLDDAIGQVTAMYPEHSQFNPEGIPVPYEVEAQWGKYLIISMPMRPTDPSNPVNYSAWLAVDSSTHQVAGLFETEKTALPSGEFEYVVTCYDENLEPLGEPYTLPTPGGFFFATEPAK